ncbi:hypothetical protein MNBD_ALPHA11-997 [hydrothermal vent metagenome]|uniref:OmpA-like domain-containing protein n=1 Tax=hydrothermal vent metagenome TaxID=652676 RepID=A0A3B0U4A5_9ZZZZ
MARRAEEEENHWPGFVDALSTIVMVVTFLLIILGIVIFVISLQINDPVDQEDERTSGIQIAELEQELAEVTEVVTQQTEVIEEREQEILELTESAAQTSVVDAGSSAQVQALTPIEEVEIVVTRVDENVATSTLRSEIETAQAVMTVLFEDNAVEMDEVSNEKATEFLEENDVIASEQKIRAISYYDGDSLSVSQAKRIAYYRLLSVRNALLSSGVDGERINISVRPGSDQGESKQNINRVKVFLQ